MTDELLTVGQVSERFGVTVRTLHHYDAIGLVQPSGRSWNGYRLYGVGDVRRLARVVMLRRVEMPLADIAEALEDAGRLADLLRLRRATVMERVEELQGLLSAIDDTMSQESAMNNYAISSEEMKEIFGSGYDEAYDREARERWGHTEAYQESQRRTKEYDAQTWQHIKDESDEIMGSFASVKRKALAFDDPEAQAAVQAHRDHIERWFNPVPVPMLRGMGQMYSSDPRFAQTYDEVEPGLAEYVSAAIAAYCDAQPN